MAFCRIGLEAVSFALACEEALAAKALRKPRTFEVRDSRALEPRLAAERTAFVRSPVSWQCPQLAAAVCKTRPRVSRAAGGPVEDCRAWGGHTPSLHCTDTEAQTHQILKMILVRVCKRDIAWIA